MAKLQKARPAKPPVRAEEKRAAATAARKSTIAKTTRQVGDGPLVLDVNDTAAWQKAERAKARVIPDATVTAEDATPESGAGLVERVSRAVERELEQIELIVGGGRVRSTQRSEAERRARGFPGANAERGAAAARHRGCAEVRL